MGEHKIRAYRLQRRLKAGRERMAEIVESGRVLKLKPIEAAFHKAFRWPQPLR